MPLCWLMEKWFHIAITGYKLLAFSTRSMLARTFTQGCVCSTHSEVLCSCVLQSVTQLPRFHAWNCLVAMSVCEDLQRSI